jgi:hypothetical protein
MRWRTLFPIKFQEGGEVLEPVADTERFPFVRKTPYEVSGLMDVPPVSGETLHALLDPLSKLGMDVEGAEGSGTFGINDKFWVLPTQMQGQRLSPDESRMLFNQGIFLGGPFDTEKEASSWEKEVLGYVGQQ